MLGAVGAIGLLAATAVGLVVVTGAGGSDGPQADCSTGLTGLADHLPAEPGTIHGADLDRAAGSGLDPEALDESDVGISDPLTRSGVDDVAYQRTDVGCWLTSGNDEGTWLVASGAFDDVQGERDVEDLGSIAVDGGLLAWAEEGDPGGLLTAREPPAALRHLVEAFDRHGAITFRGNEAFTLSDTETGAVGPEPWGGLGLRSAGEPGEEHWELLAVWAFDDVEAAQAAQPFVRRFLTEASNMGEVIEGDPAELLRRDGATLSLRAPFTPTDLSLWDEQAYDPIFTSFGDYVHLDD